MNNYFKSAIAACCLALATPASASTVTLTYNGLVLTPAETVRIRAPLSNTTVFAGGFDMSGPGGDFIAWCVDLFQTIQSGDYQTVRPTQVTDAVEEELGRLFTLAYDDALDNAISSAAFQLSIWEIVYEDGPYDVSAGDFRVSHTTQAVLHQATTWLDGLGSVTNAYRLQFYSSGQYQDVVTGTLSPVPLPAGMLLLGSALGGLAIARRRRKAA